MACDMSQFYEELEIELRQEFFWGLSVLFDLVLTSQRKTDD